MTRRDLIKMTLEFAALSMTGAVGAFAQANAVGSQLKRFAKDVGDAVLPEDVQEGFGDFIDDTPIGAIRKKSPDSFHNSFAPNVGFQGQYEPVLSRFDHGYLGVDGNLAFLREPTFTFSGELNHPELQHMLYANNPLLWQSQIMQKIPVPLTLRQPVDLVSATDFFVLTGLNPTLNRVVYWRRFWDYCGCGPMMGFGYLENNRTPRFAIIAKY